MVLVRKAPVSLLKCKSEKTANWGRKAQNVESIAENTVMVVEARIRIVTRFQHESIHESFVSSRAFGSDNNVSVLACVREGSHAEYKVV